MAKTTVNTTAELLSYAVSHSDCLTWEDVQGEYEEIKYFDTLGEALMMLENEIVGVEMTIWCNERPIGKFICFEQDGEYVNEYSISTRITVSY